VDDDASLRAKIVSDLRPQFETLEGDDYDDAVRLLQEEGLDVDRRALHRAAEEDRAQKKIEVPKIELPKKIILPKKCPAGTKGIFPRCTKA